MALLGVVVALLAAGIAIVAGRSGGARVSSVLAPGTSAPDTRLTTPARSGANTPRATTATSSASTPPSDIPAPNAEATEEGSVDATASTTGHPPAAAVDGDRSTWWAAGGSPTFTWASGRDENIVSVKLLGVTGFRAVTVDVLDGLGDVDFIQRQVLSAPDVEIEPGETDRAVRLSFEGSGQMAELQIGVFR